MSIQWVGIWPFLMFCMLAVFTLAGLVLIYKAMRILGKSYEEVNHRNIHRPLFLMIAFSLLWALFKQAVTSDIVVFHEENTALLVEIVMGVIQVIFGLWFLSSILKDINFAKKGKQE